MSSQSRSHLSRKVLIALALVALFKVGSLSWQGTPQAPTNVHVYAAGPAAAISGYYYSSFPLTESTVSESSLWTNGSTNGGGNWGDCQSSNGRIYGTRVSSGPPYDDSTCLLTGTWSGTQWAEGRAYCENTDASGTQEVELRLRSTLTSTTNTGYEVLFSCDSTDPYIQIVRWNGALNDFTLLQGATGPGIVTGSIVGASVSGTTITAYVDGVSVTSWTDSTYSSGNPGAGFWLNGQSSANLSKAGFLEFVASNGVYRTATTCSQADVNTAITAASTGDTVVIPAGSCTWTSGISFSKGIHLHGVYGGHMEGSSLTSRTPGTAPCNVGGTTCSFTLQSGTWINGFEIGETVTANYKASNAQSITGKVTGWDTSTGVLTMTVSSVVGSTARAAWTFSVNGKTIITNNAGTSTLMDVTENTTQGIELSGIHLKDGTGTGDFVHINSGGTSGKRTFVHDWRCQTETSGPRCFEVNVNRGIVFRTYVDCQFNWFATSAECTGQGWSMKNDDPTHSSWTTTSTMGTADTNGTANFYIEDCYVQGLTQGTVDLDSNSRTVIRHCVFDDAALVTHGQDTSNAGVRHYELYNNLWLYDQLGNDNNSPNLNDAFGIRGGTGVITDNTIPNITGWWGDKTEILLLIFNLRRNGGPYPCWGDGGASTYSGGTYPAPRQVGYGVTSGSSGACTGPPGGTQSGCTDASWGFRGNSEPLYVWNNTGTFAIGAGDYTPNECAVGAASISTYVQSGRDYITSAKPSYTKYAYPHTLRVYH